MNGSGWDTRSPGGARPGNGGRLALTVGAALLIVAILAAVTGKVLASNPPALPESAPAADHSERPAPDPSPEPADPRSLFLDLPDPPGSPAADPVEPSGATVSRDATPTARSVGKRSVDARGRGGGIAGRPSGGRAAAEPDIPGGGEDAAPAEAERSVRPGSGRAEDLLADPDCRFSDVARMDLEAGIVDEYLISALQAVCRKHSIYVNVFKTGHTFGAGFEEGPTIPVGYGNAGGYPNTHYFGRAADIWEVDGKPVEGNGADPSVVSVGRILAGLPSRNQPDVVIGPAAWNRALGYGPDQGWVLDADQISLHERHLHIGYWRGDGTPPPELFLPAEAASPVAASGARTPAAGGAVRRPTGTERARRAPTPKFEEVIQPATNPSPVTPPKREPVAEEKIREKPTPQKTVERRIQRPATEKAETRKPRPRRPVPERRPDPEPGRTASPEPEEPSRDGGQTTVSEEAPMHTGEDPEEPLSGGETTVEGIVPPGVDEPPE